MELWVDQDADVVEAYKLPSDKVILLEPIKGFKVQKLFVQVSVDWSVAAKLLGV